ncbi:MAG TPA: hypothetical protein VHE12_06900 [bacterium]|nr:hypothetical protein [bacterium]
MKSKQSMLKLMIPAFFIMAFFAGEASAQNVSFSSISVSNSAPNPGSTIGVTVVYCQLGTYIVPNFYVGLNPSQTTLQACPAANQTLLVDKNTGSNGISPATSTVNEATDGGGGWVGVGWNGTAACPTTQIWNVTIPAGQAPGPVNLIVQENNYYIGCDGASYPNISTVLSIPLPPPSCTATVRSEAVTAAPNGLFLFDIDYSFVNAGASNIQYTLPSNVTFVSAGPNATFSSGAVSWDLGNVTLAQTGELWALVSVNSGTADGTVIPNSATLNSANCGTSSSSTANVTVKVPQLTLTKSQSASSLAAGSTVTYTLDFTAIARNLQFYDSYDNISAGSNINLANGTVNWGYDGTSYTDYLGPVPGVDPGNWTVRSNASGDHFIEAKVTYNGGGGNGNYPELVRSIPGADICNTIIVEGDLQIPTTASGATSGADAHMIIACNPSQGITLKAGISIDNSPGNLFIQKNNIYPLDSGASIIFSSPFAVSSNQWYTMMATVHSTGAGSITYSVVLWPKGDTSKSVTLNYTDTTAVFQPTCSGGWRAGWQADETAGTNWYSNLKVFGPGPVLNASVTDVIPTGVSYVGASVAPSSTSPLVWTAPGAFPTTIFSFDTPLQWWGTVSCPGPITNSFSMTADSVAPVTSNSVTLTVNCSPTPTPPPGGCKVLLYYDNEAQGLSMAPLITVLQNAGAQVTSIGVNSPTYDPSGDNWSNYNQVWDARFYSSPINYCPSTDYGDYLNSNWQTAAVNYLNNGGSFFLYGENNGFPSRNDSNGNGQFLQTLGVVNGSFLSCPTASGPFTSSNDNSSNNINLPSSLPGNPNFFGDVVGGIPLSLMTNPGSSFVHLASGWTHVPTTLDRSVAQGWSGASELPGLAGPNVGKVFMVWDTTMWTGGDYTGGNVATINAFFTAIYQWLGGSSCTSPTPTYTPTPTPSYTPTPSPTPTNTPSCFVSTSGSSSTSASTVSSVILPSVSVSGANPLLLVQIAIDGSSPATVSSVKWGGISFSKLSNLSLTSGIELEQWYAVGLPAATNSVSVSISSTVSAVFVGATLYNGVNQSSPVIPGQGGSECYGCTTLDEGGPITYTSFGDLQVGTYIGIGASGFSFSTGQNTNWTQNNFGILVGGFDKFYAAPTNNAAITLTASAGVSQEFIWAQIQGAGCAAPTATPTVTPTPTITPTPMATPTFTPTPIGLNVWPIPYNPKYAYNGQLKAYQVPPGATMGIYTLSGEQVLPPMSPDGLGWIKWDGKNQNGVPVSAGIYYYVITKGSTVLLKGKLLIVNGN